MLYIGGWGISEISEFGNFRDIGIWGTRGGGLKSPTQKC